MDDMNTPTEMTTEDTAPEVAAKWYELDSQKKKVAAGIVAGVLAFGLGFGAAAMFTGDDNGGRDHRGDQMQQWMDGQQMPGQQMPGHHNHQWGQQMPQQGGMAPQGEMPSMGPDSGGWSHSNGS